MKELLSTLAIALTLIAFVPYIFGILKGETKPHVFSWVIWGSTTFVVFLAQLQDGGGVGAWPIGISGVITLFIAVLAFKHKSDITITPLDWVFLITAFTALPFWYLTDNPLWAVVILTIVDVLGFGPTLRKVYYKPYSEPLYFIALFAARNLIVILALEHYSITTVLFPAAVSVACILLMATMIYRRYSIGFNHI